MEIPLSGAQAPMLQHPFPFSLSFTMAARIRGPVTEDGLRRALDRLPERHPLAGSRLAASADGRGACFTTVDVPPIPLQVERRAADGEWIAAVERDVQIPFDRLAGPMLRCHWLRGEDSSDLILVSDHITADGKAAVAAMRDLLTLMANPELRLDPIPPAALRDLIPDRLRSAMQTYAARLWESGGGRNEGHSPEGELPPLRVLPFALDEPATAALAARAHAEGATVQSALCAAFAQAFAGRDPAHPVRRIESPVDIRPLLGPAAAEAYGVFISLAVTDVDCRPGRGLWDIARDAGRALKAVPELDLFTIPILLMSVLDEPLPIPPVSVTYDLSISNLGRVAIPETYGPFGLESLFGPTMTVSHPGHRLFAVNTFAGRMRCTFTSRDPAAPDLLAGGTRNLLAMIA